MMSPNGRRAWRKWVRRVEHNPKLRPPGKSISRLAREGKRHLGSIPPTPPKPFTPRSLVGMTMGARKRAVLKEMDRKDHPENGQRLDYWEVRAKYRIGERLRPCPGCCACWGADVSPADFGYDAECFGPRVTGHTKREIRRMWKWQRNLVDDCDGSGVLPARRP